MTRLMACPPTCGAAAAIICSPAFAKKHGLRSDVVILAQSMVTDPVESFDPPSMIAYAGFHMTQRAAQHGLRAGRRRPAGRARRRTA